MPERGRTAVVDGEHHVRAVLFTGSARYADPWHPFAETSARLGELLAEAGVEVELHERVETAFAALDGARLLVVNAGDPDGPGADGGPARPPAGREQAAVVAGEAQLRAAVDRGIGILVMHAGVSSLREFGVFGEAIGGRWVRGGSWHPPYGDAHVRFVGEHPIRSTLVDAVVQDERYTDLEFTGPVEVIAEHDEGGRSHPLVWARELGRARVVVDLLGHDAASYEAPGHRELLRRSIDWLLQR
ncbi:ThuA domain-containing protein [Agromyces sp. NPDC058136]|uniref:ThuA domain-containing protein n=1 Tax=Agromyces sp. NPDC058136 TaxID=3346354 RepID=UPI0036D938F6